MLKDLNPQQKKAVMHNQGPILVFAGAGSGKTRVITHRIARLIMDGITDSDHILALTFTKKAAGEMKGRVKELLSQNSKLSITGLPYVGTFHGFGASVLRRDGMNIGIPSNFSIFDPNDGVQIVKGIMDDLNIDQKQFTPKTILRLISSAKNEMVLPEDYTGFARGPIESQAALIYPKYEEALREQAAIDFDDLQILPLKLFEENDSVLKKYNEKYEYIMVDEYQDTNTVQYRLIKKLSGAQCNLCVVGDDDQGIYSWRGATIKNILQFERDFTGAKIVKLEKNYRSTRNILHAAHAVIVKNSERAEKELWTDQERGNKIILYSASNPRDEAKFIVDNIKQLKRDGKNAGDVGILYRINALSRVVEEELLRNAIPYKLVGAVRFYERREIKDILAYLRFFSNPLDDVSFMRVVNVPPRKIGKMSLSNIESFARKISKGEVGIGLLTLILWGYSQGIKNWKEYLPGIEISDSVLTELASDDCVEFARKNAKLIALFGKLYDISMQENVRILLDEILSSTKYGDWINDGTDQARARMENLYEIKVVSEQYSVLGPRDSLLAFLSDVALVEQEKKVNCEQDDDVVTLMTLHSAKGLEFDTVFMIGMEEGMLPHSRSFTSPSELEEERRLCYVGITRAKSSLIMSFAENRRTYGGLSDRVSSRFINEIPEEIIECATWNKGGLY